MYDDLPLVVQDPHVAPRHHDLLATHACHPARGHHDVPDCSGSRVDEELIDLAEVLAVRGFDLGADEACTTVCTAVGSS
jgi:hypothetical protein